MSRLSVLGITNLQLSSNAPRQRPTLRREVEINHEVEIRSVNWSGIADESVSFLGNDDSSVIYTMSVSIIWDWRKTSFVESTLMGKTPIDFNQRSTRLTLSSLEKPAPVQQRAIVPLLKGRDVIMQAQSGTGKTAAFVIAILQQVTVTLMSSRLLQTRLFYVSWTYPLGGHRHSSSHRLASWLYKFRK